MIIFVDQKSGSWTDSTNAGIDLLPNAVAVRKETCQFGEDGLVKSVGPVLDTSPFEYKEGNENMINEDTQEVGDSGDLDDMPEVLKSTPRETMAGEMAKLGAEVFNGVPAPKKRGRPAGAKTIPWPEPWASRAKKAGGKTLLAKRLGITYDLLNKVVKGEAEFPEPANLINIDALPLP